MSRFWLWAFETHQVEGLQSRPLRRRNDATIEVLKWHVTSSFFFFNICSSRSDGLCSVHEPRSTTAVNQRDSLEVALPKTEKMWQCSNPVTWQTVTLQREVVLTVQHSVQSVCGWTGTFARTNLQARNAEEGGSKWSIGNILKSAVYTVTVCTDAIFFL